MQVITNQLRQTQSASAFLAQLSDERRAEIIVNAADELENSYQSILQANIDDLTRMSMTDPKYDRLLLSESRIKSIAMDMRKVASLTSPLDKILDEKTLPNGLEMQKISVPMGVIGIIYEARPNVTADAFSLCLKAGSACVLKGGSDAQFSNTAIVKVIHRVLQAHSVPESTLYLMPTDREATNQLLQSVGLIDVIIPRGSQGLIDFVRQNSRVPVIETGAGIVHIYFAESGSLEKGRDIIFNAKTRRVSVCNALDTLIIDISRLADLPELMLKLAEKNVQIFADNQALKALQDKYPAELLHPAEETHFGTEFLDYKMSIKTVNGLEAALEHIARYSSKHSESIIAEEQSTCEIFLKRVDAAVVYANASTSFTDGGEFGFGAEIGISTQKLHARGPMALPEITSYKWIVRGSGQIR